MGLGQGYSEQLHTVFGNLGAVGVAELLSEIVAVADLDHALVRIPSEEVARKRGCHRHGLAMSRRHEDHQAFRLAGEDLFQLRADEVEMSGSFPSAVMDILDVINVSYIVFPYKNDQ